MSGSDGMDLVTSVRQYLAEMVRVAGPGMKVLLMDKETTGVVSCAYAQSEMMSKEVFLFQRLDSQGPRDPIRHLKCLAFLRPTPENLQLLAAELRRPAYGQYYIYFSNVISKAEVKSLAEADEQECVRELQEFYADFVPLAPHHFSLGLATPVFHSLSLAPQPLRRSLHGLASILLALKRSPLIRYQASSPATKQLAQALHTLICKEDRLFQFRTHSDPPTLLILDRKEDPVTPLLNQWTYQAMVHELLGIHNNRVSLDSVPSVPKDMKEVVLSARTDEFYAGNLYANFGEIGSRCKELMEAFQQRAKTSQKLESIADMKAFVDAYPEFKKLSGTVAKHVTVVGELSRLVSLYNLLEISELEQELAVGEDQSRALSAVKRLLSHEKTSDLEATRLVCLYALHYQRHPSADINSLLSALRRRGVPDKYAKAVGDLLAYAGADKRSSDLFSNQSTAALTKKFIKGLKGVENVFTQHRPYLLELLEAMEKGRLKEAAYPALGQSLVAGARAGEVIVFIVGGTTYAESMFVHNFNRSNASGMRVLLGGTSVLNARSFIEEVMAANSASIRSSSSQQPPLS